MTKERVCKFRYNYEWAAEKDALKEKFTQNGIKFICHESNGGWPHEFVVMRSGKKWDDIYRIVNSVHAVRYSLETVYLTDDLAHETAQEETIYA